MMARHLGASGRLLRSSWVQYRLELANIAWLIGDRLLRVLGTFGITVFAARLMGPADFGDVSFAQTVLAFLMLWVALGLQSVVVKHVISDPADAGAILGTACLLQALCVAATLCIMLGYHLSLGAAASSYETLAMIMAAGLLLRPTEIIRYWFESQVRAKYAVLADNVAFLFGSVLKLAALYFWHSIEAFAWATAIEQLIVGVCLILLYRRYPGRPSRWRVRLALLRPMLDTAWPLLFAGIAIAVYTRIDQLVLMHFQGSGETGIFSAASRLSELFYVLPTVLATTLFPRLQRMHLTSPGQHFRAMSGLMAALTTVSTLISLGITILASPIVGLIYGASYASAAAVLGVHIWTTVFVCLGVLGNQWYLSHGLQRKTLLFTVLGAVTNFSVNLLLVPIWGALGAAFASLAAQIVSAFLADMMSADTRPIFYAKTKALIFPVTGIYMLIKKVVE